MIFDTHYNSNLNLHIIPFLINNMPLDVECCSCDLLVAIRRSLLQKKVPSLSKTVEFNNKAILNRIGITIKQ